MPFALIAWSSSRLLIVDESVEPKTQVTSPESAVESPTSVTEKSVALTPATLPLTVMVFPSYVAPAASASVEYAVISSSTVTGVEVDVDPEEVVVSLDEEPFCDVVVLLDGELSVVLEPNLNVPLVAIPTPPTANMITSTTDKISIKFEELPFPGGRP